MFTTIMSLQHRQTELLPNIKGSHDLDYIKVNRIPAHCGVVYESVHPLARGHVIRVCNHTHFRFNRAIPISKPPLQGEVILGIHCTCCNSILLTLHWCILNSILHLCHIVTPLPHIQNYLIPLATPTLQIIIRLPPPLFKMEQPLYFNM